MTIREPHVLPGRQAEPIACGRRFCRGCGRWRHVCDFPYRQGGVMDSRCCACHRAQRRRYYANASQARRESQREYHRIYQEGLRRAAGRRERNGRRLPPDPRTNGAAARWLDAGPLVAVLTRYLDRGRTYRELCLAAVVPERRVYALMTGEQAQVHYAVADRLCVAMGMTLAIVYGQA